MHSSSLVEKNKSAYQYSEAIHERFKQICEPLSHLDITYFGYMKIFNNGSFFVMTTNMAFQQDYLFKEGGFGDIFSEVYSTVSNKRYFLTPYNELSIVNDRTISLAATHNIWDTLNIYQNINGCLHGYFIGTDKPNSMFSQFYLNNISLIEHYVSYFAENAKDLIDTTDNKKLAYFDQTFSFDKFSEEKILAENVENFLQATCMPRIFSKNKNRFVHLTKREAECLHYLSQGKTMKEIGRTLDLSPKTIEFYIRNIKEKAEYSSKSELLMQFSKNSPINGQHT